MKAVMAYEGNEPYIFISYAHADAPAVMEVLADMQERGYRLWYDAGIVAGSEWPEYIAEHLARASLVIAFVSGAYAASDNCRREMHFALSKRIPTLNVFLEETRLSPGLEMQIGSSFALMKYGMNDASFREKLYGAPLLQGDTLLETGPARPTARKMAKAPAKPKKKKARRITALVLSLVLLAALVTLGIVGWSTGLAQRLWILSRQSEPVMLAGETAVSFESPLLEQAARAYSGLAEGTITVSDLAGLTELRLRDGGFSLAAGEDWREADDLLTDLGDLRWFPNLSSLYLEDAVLSSLESLPLCTLERLELRNVRLLSLEGVGHAQKLRELVVEDCPVSSLGDLENCLQLRKLSLRGTGVSDFSALRPLIRLAEFSASGCGINELRTVFRLSRLTDVSLYDCDLRGSFFKIFDRERVIVSLSLIDCKLNSTANLKDFRGLTTLRLERTGENLDWSALRALPVLKTVTVDSTMEETIRAALAGSQVQLTVLS